LDINNLRHPGSAHWLGTAHPNLTALSPRQRRTRIKNGRAKILDDAEIHRVREYISQTSSMVESDDLKFLLSVRAGLRASEVAAIHISALVSADGRVGKTIELRADWAKNSRSRSIPMHPEVSEAVKRFRMRFPSAAFVSISKRTGHKQLSANAVTVWFHELYAKVGFQGCSSHSGRRTFITALARRANEYGASLKDVQRIAGHLRLDTTECYIEYCEDVGDLVCSL
jgi:integrase